MVDYLLTNLINAAMSVLIFLIGFWLFKAVIFGRDFKFVLMEKGISGGAIVLAAFLLALGLVVGRAAF